MSEFNNHDLVKENEMLKNTIESYYEKFIKLRKELDVYLKFIAELIATGQICINDKKIIDLMNEYEQLSEQIHANDKQIHVNDKQINELVNDKNRTN